MVPCQPRQLVILSLPFAALVAFFWYKRRRSLSRSDPGGTLAPIELVDNTANLSTPNSNKTELKVKANNIENICSLPPKTEEFIVKKTEVVASSSPKFKTNVDPFNVAVSKAADKSDSLVVKEETVCNGAAVSVKEESKIVNILCKKVEDIPEENRIFHSTIIEDEKDFEESLFVSSEGDRLVKETVEHCEVQKIEAIDNFVSNNSIEKNIKEQVSLISIKSKDKHQNIPLEEQSTLENSRLKKDITEASVEKPKLIEQSNCTEVVEDNLVEGGYNGKEVSSISSDVVDKEEDISTDTGVGSQDLSSRTEDSHNNDNMAQGQKTEEKAESNATGLEQKLASLGLDTQQPVQRDSANHSPAEVMLNSPAISTFSDAHSEGSSDSGKGCSDVVTPPSRTPAGGSSVAGDQVPSVYEFVLPQVIVGRLIGRHGTFLHDIRAKTHTNVFIKRHPETSTLKICAIEGTQPDIDAALKMIRHKFPLRRFQDLTLEKVTFVKHSSLPISPENLQLNLVDGVNNDVLLSSLITAGHFFLQLPMHMSYQSLYRLACIMNTVYNTQESPPLPDPQPDVICVAPAHGGWYRAQILSVNEEAGTSDIRFLDYGGFVTVDNSLLRQIRGDFLLLPFQAVECALANVIPAGGEEEWSEEAKQFVQLMTTQQTLQAQVYDYTETRLPLVYLYCTQFYQSPNDPSGFETKVVLLNQELVSRGFADLIDTSSEDEPTTVTESS